MAARRPGLAAGAAAICQTDCLGFAIIALPPDFIASPDFIAIARHGAALGALSRQRLKNQTGGRRVQVSRSLARVVSFD
jgi:hypothetical protein